MSLSANTKALILVQILGRAVFKFAALCPVGLVVSLLAHLPPFIAFFYWGGIFLWGCWFSLVILGSYLKVRAKVLVHAADFDSGT